MKCPVHTEFFDDSCSSCKVEYLEMKRPWETGADAKKYKEFTEERAKKLYGELFLQYLKSGEKEFEADRKARAIIRKQCSIRGVPCWPWI